VPLGCPNPRGFSGKAGESYSSPIGRNSAVSSDFADGIGPHVLLAMQKVEGSNPFSRFEKGLYLQAFFACAVGLCVCVGPRSENRICCCAASLLSVLLFPL
jgi:hypothetical protein